MNKINLTKIFKKNKKNRTQELSLEEKIDKLEKELKRQRSLPRLIYKAIINGIFATFGATIVFGLLIIKINRMIEKSEEIPIINKIIEKSELKNLFSNYEQNCQ